MPDTITTEFLALRDRYIASCFTKLNPVLLVLAVIVLAVFAILRAARRRRPQKPIQPPPAPPAQAPGTAAAGERPAPKYGPEQ